MKIGVFDSGVGGDSVVRAITKALPDLEIIYREDKIHVPYGDKPVEEIYGYVMPILKEMIEAGCQVLVIACNTVTTNLIERLRGELNPPLVGLEPMVKPAAEQTKSGVIAVCATPSTLTSDRYRYLKRTYAQNVQVIEPDCSDWATMIEDNNVNTGEIKQQLDQMLSAGADQIVLGCTHYHWIEDLIERIVQGRAIILQPEQPVIEQLKRVLAQLA